MPPPHPPRPLTRSLLSSLSQNNKDEMVDLAAKGWKVRWQCLYSIFIWLTWFLSFLLYQRLYFYPSGIRQYDRCCSIELSLGITTCVNGLISVCYWYYFFCCFHWDCNRKQENIFANKKHLNKATMLNLKHWGSVHLHSQTLPPPLGVRAQNIFLYHGSDSITLHNKFRNNEALYAPPPHTA